jgi:hypothetical protein
MPISHTLQSFSRTLSETSPRFHAIPAEIIRATLLISPISPLTMMLWKYCLPLSNQVFCYLAIWSSHHLRYDSRRAPLLKETLAHCTHWDKVLPH